MRFHFVCFYIITEQALLSSDLSNKPFLLKSAQTFSSARRKILQDIEITKNDISFRLP
jgi:hypothetical protein